LESCSTVPKSSLIFSHHQAICQNSNVRATTPLFYSRLKLLENDQDPSHYVGYIAGFVETIQLSKDSCIFEKLEPESSPPKVMGRHFLNVECRFSNFKYEDKTVLEVDSDDYTYTIYRIADRKLIVVPKAHCSVLPTNPKEII
jgi:hypothetical protein